MVLIQNLLDVDVVNLNRVSEILPEEGVGYADVRSNKIPVPIEP